MPDTTPEIGIGGILRNLEQYIGYLKEQGVTVVPADEIQEARDPMAGAARAPRSGPAEALAQIADEIAACRKCGLAQGRNRTVPGHGNPAPELMFVGEGPGEEEDQQGLPFVGAAGQLLTRMLQAMGMTRNEVFIGNVVKCRPPGNRTPMPEEIEQCLPYLRAQIALLKPRVIVALGATAARGLLQVETGITRLRGRWQTFEGIPVMPTYHPAYLLRAPSAKREAWDDMLAVLEKLGRPPPERKPRA